MILARAATGAGLAAAGAWVGYAWLPHLLTTACPRRGPAGRPRIALTFDDGPDPLWTPRILDTLGAYGVRATFFLVGARAAAAPSVVRATAAGGHEIGNHGWSHRSFWLCGPRRTEDEIARAHDALADLAGRPPRHFRPPWGMVNAAMFGALRRVGERCVFWSVQPEGLRPRSGRDQAAHVMRHARPGAIVDLHDAPGLPDAPARLAAGLPAMVEGLRAAGFVFTTVAELLDGVPDPSH